MPITTKSEDHLLSEIGFYHLQRSTLAETLPKLLEKALATGMRVVVQAPSEAEVERLSAALWTYGDGSFLPHGSAKDGWETEQPIFLTAVARNPNGADMLVQTSGAEWGLMDEFRRVLDMFDGRDPDELAAARDRWKRYKAAAHDVTYWQQRAEGGWERKV